MSDINPTNMYFQIMLVTPDMAREWLKTNDRNRTPNRDKLSKIKYDLTHGLFELTHQAIAFDVDGKLIDGQHRLIEIAETGISAPLSIAYNAPRTANMDIGTKRTQKQALYMAGIIEKKTTEYDSLTYPLLSFMTFRSMGEQRVRTMTAINKHLLYLHYQMIIDPIINIGRSANGKCRSSVIMYAMLCAYNAGVDIETITKWHKIVETGDFYVDGNDELTRAGRSVLLFKKVANENTQISVTRATSEQIETVLKKAMSSIYHFTNKKPISKLYGELVYEDVPVVEEYMYKKEA